jgi:hypothetical protein
MSTLPRFKNKKIVVELLQRLGLRQRLVKRSATFDGYTEFDLRSEFLEKIILILKIFGLVRCVAPALSLN